MFTDPYANRLRKNAQEASSWFILKAKASFPRDCSIRLKAGSVDLILTTTRGEPEKMGVSANRISQRNATELVERGVLKQGAAPRHKAKARGKGFCARARARALVFYRCLYLCAFTLACVYRIPYHAFFGR